MLPCFLQEGEPITPTGEPLNENLEPLKQDDVDTSNRPGQNPDSVVDKIPNSTVTQSEWHGRHTEEEMDVIINSNTPEKHILFGRYCRALAKATWREVQRQLAMKSMNDIIIKKAHAVKRLYYAELIKILENLDRHQTFLSDEDRDLNVFDCLSDSGSGLLTYIPFMMNDFTHLGICYINPREIGLSWYLSMESYPRVIRHVLLHAAIAILKPYGYKNFTPHGPDEVRFGIDVLKILEEDARSRDSINDDKYKYFREIACEYTVQCVKCPYRQSLLSYPSDIFERVDGKEIQKKTFNNICPRCSSSDFGLVYKPGTNR